MENDKQRIRILASAGQIFYELKYYEQAIKMCDGILKSEPDNTWAKNLKVKCLKEDIISIKNVQQLLALFSQYEGKKIRITLYFAAISKEGQAIFGDMQGGVIWVEYPRNLGLTMANLNDNDPCAIVGIPQKGDFGYSSIWLIDIQQ
mgnify:CR=1 FL=1